MSPSTPRVVALVAAVALSVGLCAAPASAAPGGPAAAGAAAAPPVLAGVPGTASAAAGDVAHLHDDTVPVPSRVLQGARLEPGVTTQASRSAAAGVVTTHVVDVTTVATTTTTADDTVAELDAASVERAVASLHDFWWEESAGAVDVRLGRVETLQLDRAACDAGDASRTARERSHGGRYDRWGWVGTDAHLLVLTREACGTQAFATVGGEGGEIFSSYGLGAALGVPVLLHEFGHNLGLGHAGSGLCRGAAVDAPLASYRYASGGDATVPCPVEEYGDLTDIMGYSITGATPHLSSLQRVRAGWLDDVTTVATPGTTTRVTLRPLDAAGGGRALTVVDPRSRETYHVEYRTPSGRDATSVEFGRYRPRCTDAGQGWTKCDLTSDPATGGVRVLRPLTSAGVVSTVAVAAGPVAGAAATTRDTHLDAGERFVGAGGGVTVTVASLSPTGGAVLDVVLAGPRPAVASTTSLVLSGARQTHAGTPVRATATVVTADGTPARGTVALLDGGTRLTAQALDASGRAVLAVPATLAAGSHALTAAFTPADAGQQGSTSAVATLTVDRAPTSTTLRQSATSQTYGTTTGVTLTATVAPVAGSSPAGSVTFSRGGTAVATVATSGGTARWTLPGTTPVGTGTWAATFVPAHASLARSASAALSVTVLRAASTTTASPSSTSVPRGVTSRLTVTVAAAGVPAPTGTLTVRTGTTTLATATVRATDRGRVTVTLPAQRRAGSYPIVVSYSGDASVAGSASRAVTLQVR